jgi:uncharacterized protein YecE (DUF72 family)
MDNLFIGTSGWSYDGWAGDFYPEEIDKVDMLDYYVDQFKSVEINATFYRLPFDNMVKGWSNKAPEGFQYSVKAPRQITHYDKLDADRDYLNDFYERIDGLDDHLGPILWQLPPSLEKDMNRLKSFLEIIDTNLSNAIEFRDETWLDDEVYSELESNGVVSVAISSDSMPASFQDTGNFIYYRFHGLGEGHNYNYSKKELDEWADRCAKALDEGKKAYVYFNNTSSGDAPMNAKVFSDMVERKTE